MKADDFWGHAEIISLVQMKLDLISPFIKKKKGRKKLKEVEVHFNASYRRWSEERGGLHAEGEGKRLITSVKFIMGNHYSSYFTQSEVEKRIWL